MIRFVDIRNQGVGSRFAFWNTVTDRFVEIEGEQAWNNWDDFLEVAEGYPIVERFKGLCRDWVFDDGEDDIEGWHES